jgi:hypothetical protein
MLDFIHMAQIMTRQDALVGALNYAEVHKHRGQMARMDLRLFVIDI